MEDIKVVFWENYFEDQQKKVNTNGIFSTISAHQNFEAKNQIYVLGVEIPSTS